MTILPTIFALLLMTAYWPGISGVATTARWDVAALLAVVLFFLPRTRLSSPHYFGLVLLGWMFASIAWNSGGTDGRLDGVNEAMQLVLVATAFAVGSRLSDLRFLLIGAANGIWINGVVAIGQYAGFDWWGVIQAKDGSAAGLFYDKDRLAAVAAMVAVGTLAIPEIRLMAVLTLPALLLTGSRSAWLALAVALPCMAPSISARIITGAVAALVCALVAVHGIGPSGHERLAIWQDTIANLNFFGHGLGSFREVFLQTAKTYDFSYWQSRPEAPHNEPLWIAFEGGVPAVALAMAFALSLWRAAAEYPERGMLACLGVLALFAMPLHDPATVILGAIVAGSVAARHDLARIVTLDCRSALCPWLASLDGGRWAQAVEGSLSRFPVPATLSRGDGQAIGDLCEDGEMTELERTNRRST